MSDIVTERIAIPGEVRIQYDITGEVADTAVQQPISGEMLELVKAINTPASEHPIVTLPEPAIEAGEPSAVSANMEAALREPGYRGAHRVETHLSAAFYAMLGVLGVTYGLAIQLTPGATASAVLTVTSLFSLIVGGVLLGMTLAPKES